MQSSIPKYFSIRDSYFRVQVSTWSSDIAIDIAVRRATRISLFGLH